MDLQFPQPTDLNDSTQNVASTSRPQLTPDQQISLGAEPVVEARGLTDDQYLDLMADDADVIEKDWVYKVKQLETAYAQDPGAFANAFAQMRASYLKKRFNKDIKSSEKVS